MPDFTSTGLVSLLIHRLHVVAPDLARGLSRPDPMHRAIEEDGRKRALVDQVMDTCGPGPLLSIGLSMPAADEMPMATVLTRSPSPDVLAEKWTRLERYHHATHHVRIDTTRPGAWHCTRWSDAAPPTVGENCLIAGLLIGLCGMIGVQGLHLHIGRRAIPAPDLADATLPPGETCATFAITWTGTSEPPPTPPDRPGALADRLTDLLASDIGRSWRIGDAARDLALSPRSLQRHLSAEGRSFSSVLRRARMREATRLLSDNRIALAEVGYCCGYADQAHFQRDFLRATNITPRVFRDLSVQGETAASPS
jgi:AraC-like DNA-binding protein